MVSGCMSVLFFKKSLGLAVLTGWIALPVCAQMNTEVPVSNLQAARPAAGESAVPPERVEVRRSGLWTVIDTEYRRPSELTDAMTRRLTEAERAQLREQVRRSLVHVQDARPVTAATVSTQPTKP